MSSHQNTQEDTCNSVYMVLFKYKAKQAVCSSLTLWWLRKCLFYNNFFKDGLHVTQIHSKSSPWFLIWKVTKMCVPYQYSTMLQQKYICWGKITFPVPSSYKYGPEKTAHVLTFKYNIESNFTLQVTVSLGTEPLIPIQYETCGRMWYGHNEEKILGPSWVTCH